MPEIQAQSSAFPGEIEYGTALGGGGCLVGDVSVSANFLAAAGVWPSANLALYAAFYTDSPVKIQKAIVNVAVQSGNLDVGLYDEKGNCLVSKGSTAVAAAGNQIIDLTTAISLGTASPTVGPGTYYMAMNCDNVTASFSRMALNGPLGRITGMLQQAVGAVALPATATFAAYTQLYCPALLLKAVAAT